MFLGTSEDGGDGLTFLLVRCITDSHWIAALDRFVELGQWSPGKKHRCSHYLSKIPCWAKSSSCVFFILMVLYR